MVLETANGQIHAKKEALVDLVNIGVGTRAIILPNSPSLLSLGKRCMDEGYDFEWRRGRKQVLTTPDGRRVALEVENFCPVLPVGLGGAGKPVHASINAAEAAPAVQGNLRGDPKEPPAQGNLRGQSKKPQNYCRRSTI